MSYDDDEKGDTQKSTLTEMIVFWSFIGGIACAFVMAFFVFLALVPLPAFAVVYWPDLQQFIIDNGLVRLLFALSLVASGFVLYRFRDRMPRTYAFVEAGVAVFLGWVALGSESADRLTVAIALLTACYIVVRAATLYHQAIKPIGKKAVRVVVYKNDVRIFTGEELEAVIPKDLGQVVYKIQLRDVNERISRIEEKLNDQ